MPLSLLVGIALLLLGCAVMLGWWLQIPGVVRVLPGYAPMVFNTALCFGLAGSALLLPLTSPWSALWRAIAGNLLVGLAGAVLAEHLLQVNLGVDWPSLHAWLLDANPNPGRMSRGTATAFLISGVVLILAGHSRPAWLRTAAPVLTLGVGSIGALGVAGYLVSAQLLFPEYWFTGIAVHTAFGLLLLAVGLWSILWPLGPIRKAVFAREDDRIAFVGAAVLVVTGLGVGLATFSVLQDRVQTLVRDDLLLAHARRVDVFQDMIELREGSARIAATRPAVLRNLRAIRSGRDDGANLANVRAVVDSFLQENFSAIAYHDLDGKVVAKGGRFAETPAISVALATPNNAELLWHQGFLVRHRIPMHDSAGQVGELLVEQPLPVLTRLTEKATGRGETWDMGVCVRRSEQLVCFPQRLTREVFSTPLVNVAGEALPMTRALRGENGTVITRDYRAQNVVAAYGPVGSLGLGMVLKVDAAEVFQPIREQLLLAMGLLALLVAGGTLLLRSQVTPLATRLMEKNVELANAMQAKDSFLATMSHELRTPLNAIIGFTGTLLMKLPGPLNTDQEKQLGTVQASARLLLALINDLLDLAKINAGKVELKLEPTPCRGVLQEVGATLRPLAERKGLQLTVDAPAEEMVAQTDRRALSQIVLNLASNAIKFTERGSVRLALARRSAGSEDTIEISVVDSGIGIREEDQTKLFEAFTQLDRAGRSSQEGTGLGLHLSQKLAELMRARIEFVSVPGKGSRFSLLVPAAPKQP
jgi:signal transduction histidine kinase